MAKYSPHRPSQGRCCGSVRHQRAGSAGASV